jgi:predicted nucleic acid-binding Zn ribbon protein
VDLVPLEEARALRARPLAELTPRVLEALGVERKRGETEILKVWNHSLDPAIVAHAQPTGLHKGTLFVAVDSSVWLDEIVRYRRREILERLQHSFGRAAIQRISFRVG